MIHPKGLASQGGYPYFQDNPCWLRGELREDHFYGRPYPQRRQGLTSWIIDGKLQSLEGESINFQSDGCRFGGDRGSVKLNVPSWTLDFQILPFNSTFQTEVSKIGWMKGGFYEEIFPTVVYFPWYTTPFFVYSTQQKANSHHSTGGPKIQSHYG